MLLREKLQQMFVEAVPHSTYDSGSAYGYLHERNKEVDLDAEPVVRFHVRVLQDKSLEIYPVRSLYRHFLNTLEYDVDLDNYFQAFLEQSTSDEPVQEFLGRLECNNGMTDESDGYARAYTYTYDTFLDQNFIWHSFGIGDQNYVVIELHGGCDARGGFTSPVLFRLPKHETTDSVVFPDTDFYVGFDMDNYARYILGGSTPLALVELVGSGIDVTAYPVTTSLNRRGRTWVVYDTETDTLYCPLTGQPLRMWV